MTKLKEQNTLLSSLQQNVTKSTIGNWNLLINCLPSNIFNFGRKAFIFSLSNNSNLASNCDIKQLHWYNQQCSIQMAL